MVSCTSSYTDYSHSKETHHYRFDITKKFLLANIQHKQMDNYYKTATANTAIFIYVECLSSSYALMHELNKLTIDIGLLGIGVARHAAIAAHSHFQSKYHTIK